MPVEKDNFGEFALALRRVTDLQRMMREAERYSVKLRETAYLHIDLVAPEATAETFMTTGHTDHVAIKAGWLFPPPKRDGARVSADLNNRSQHVGWQRTGTVNKGYRIPYGPTFSVGIDPVYGIEVAARHHLEFWLGPPLKWPIREAKFFKPGFVYMTQVKHPGFGPWKGRDFVEVGVERARPEMRRQFHEMGEWAVFKPLRDFFG